MEDQLVLGPSGTVGEGYGTFFPLFHFISARIEWLVPKRFPLLGSPFSGPLAGGNRLFFVCAYWWFWVEGFCSILAETYGGSKKTRELTSTLLLKLLAI